MRTVLALCALALAAFALPVSAASGQAPDDSAIDQYVESVPGAGGDQPVDEETGAPAGNSGGGAGGGGSGGSGGDGSGGSGGEETAISPGVEDDLENAGEAGSAAAGLAEDTAPSGTPAGGGDVGANQTGGGGGANQPAGGGGANQPAGGGGANQPGGGGGGESPSGGAASTSGVAGSDTGGDGVVELVADAVDGESEGMGPALPIILGLSLLVALAALFFRVRDLFSIRDAQTK